MRQGNRMLSLAVALDPPVAVGRVADDTLAGVPVRIYRPEAAGPAPTIVFLHGGGFIVGDLDTHDSVCRRLVRDLGAVVVSVAYRLAPEHPFPAGYEDSVGAARHVADHIDDFGGGKLAVAGDSAGGNLAAGVAQAFRDEGRPLAAQLLAYPATDLSGTRDYPSHRERHRVPAHHRRGPAQHRDLPRRRPHGCGPPSGITPAGQEPHRSGPGRCRHRRLRPAA
jgi:acetyl esterase